MDLADYDVTGLGDGSRGGHCDGERLTWACALGPVSDVAALKALRAQTAAREPVGAVARRTREAS